MRTIRKLKTTFEHCQVENVFIALCTDLFFQVGYCAAKGDDGFLLDGELEIVETLI
jgi:hypothetical protein